MRPHLITKESWTFILLTAVCVTALFLCVDLTPKVDYEVFFSKEDPSYKSDIEISRLFVRNDDQILISIKGDIYSPLYKKKVGRFGDILLDQENVADVKSIVHGPRDVEHAVKSPFWSRLVGSEDLSSSNIVVMLKPGLKPSQLQTLIRKIDDLRDIFSSGDFNADLSGYPYIVELIRRHLNRDMRVFSSLALIVFGIVIIFVFHSWPIFLGMIASCFSAASITLMTAHFLHAKIGILTANLITIVFVLTLSHIIFLTFNWKHLYPAIDRKKAARDAVRITLPASFWAMFTTLLGFISLLYVQAKPIRELGISGAIGTCVAFLMAYCIFPSFLGLQVPMHAKADDKISRIFKGTFHFFDRRRRLVVACIAGLVIITAPSLGQLNMDPSLISFFNRKSDITEGLRAIDSQGGSNPLVFVVKDIAGEPVYTKDNQKKLRRLQKDLEDHPDVGIVLSMSPLLKEARQSSFLSFLVSNKGLLERMDSPRYGRITRSFVSSDSQHALFLLRMKEESRKKQRLQIIDELKVKARDNGLTPYLVGGVYALQGHLSEHVASSLVFGLVRLILVFLLIALITSRALQISLAMTFSICLIPLGILGPIAALKIPLDMIAAPSANIAISMGIDAMIHMVHAFHRMRKQFPKRDDIWHLVRQKLWEPVMTSTIIVSCGFGIFFFSSFPPTQRFGGSIVLGTVLSAGCALFIFPLLSGKAPVRKKPEPLSHNRVKSYIKH